MSIVSYAQNFEDVMLWRALGHIQNGMYIDIGAQDPVVDSVSLTFHENAWRGIHVEPTPHYAELLRQQRPGDKIIQAAVANKTGNLPFFEIRDTGISTADATIADQHRKRGYEIHEISVPFITLATIFKQCREHEIHWLKIDVEGFEEQVLRSWGTAKARPWIVVVESTLPCTRIESHKSWETILLERNYIPVYFDGLNRFYISDAHSELKLAFAVPPNLFDGFQVNGTSSWPLYHLIQSRHKLEISQTLEQHTEQQQDLRDEIEHLSVDATNLKAARGNDHTNWAARERELTDLLIDATTVAASEKNALKLTHAHREREREATHTEQNAVAIQRVQRLESELGALQHEYAKIKTTLADEVDKAKIQITELQMHAEAREEEHSKVVRQLKSQLYDSAENYVQRERDLTDRLHEHQQQSARTNAEQARDFLQQERARQQKHLGQNAALVSQLNTAHLEIQRLLSQQASREDRHAEILDEARTDLDRAVSAHLERERQLTAQLLADQQQAAKAKEEQTLKYVEQVRQLTELTNLKNMEIYTLRAELAAEKEVWRQRKNSLTVEIEARRSEASALKQVNQLAAQLHVNALSLEAQNGAVIRKGYAGVEAQLRAEIRSEQQVNFEINQLLVESQRTIQVIHASLMWRIAAPFRKLRSTQHLSAPKHFASKLANSAFIHPAQVATESQPSSASQLFTLLKSPMSKPLQASYSHLPKKASTLLELIAHDGERFVECAYITLLGRAPDDEGMHYYFNRLRTGISKTEIVAQLCTSREGKNSGANLPELPKLLRHHKVTRIPFIGWIFKRSVQAQSVLAALEAIRIVNNQILKSDEQTHQRLFSLQQSIDEIRTELSLKLTDNVLISTGTTPFNKQVIAADQLATAGFRRTLTTERDIYFQLKSAISSNASHEGNK